MTATERVRLVGGFTRIGAVVGIPVAAVAFGGVAFRVENANRSLAGLPGVSPALTSDPAAALNIISYAAYMVLACFAGLVMGLAAGALLGAAYLILLDTAAAVGVMQTIVARSGVDTNGRRHVERSWFRGLSGRAVLFASRLIPVHYRSRYLEEWAGELASLSGHRRRIFTWGLLLAVPQVAMMLRGTAVRSENDE